MWTLVSVTLERDGNKTDTYGANPQGQTIFVPQRPFEAIREAETWLKDLKGAGGVPNCTDFAECFSRLSVLTKPKLRLRSPHPSAPQNARSRSR
jgi:hypothetical protein